MTGPLSLANAGAGGTPGAPQTTFSGAGNELSQEPHVSTGATGTRGPTNTNTISGVYTNTIQIQRKNCIRAIRVSEFQWKLFLQKARELGFSANELINQFINSIVLQTPPQTSKSQVTFNVAIAKAESKPVINVGEYVARKELDDLVLKARRLRERAARERSQADFPMTFTVEQAKRLEAEIRKVLKPLRRLDPEKLQEVEVAFEVLRSIREGKA